MAEMCEELIIPTLSLTPPFDLHSKIANFSKRLTTGNTHYLYENLHRRSMMGRPPYGGDSTLYVMTRLLGHLLLKLTAILCAQLQFSCRFVLTASRDGEAAPSLSLGSFTLSFDESFSNGSSSFNGNSFFNGSSFSNSNSFFLNGISNCTPK